jgi:hypothetical protein
VDAADLIDSFLTGSYTVTRRATAIMVDGIGEQQPASTLSIDASVQPASGRDLQRLPEGRRTIETRIVFTITELFAGGQGVQYEADQVEIDGDQWEVQQVQPWRSSPSSDIGYYRAIVQAVNTQAVGQP